MKSPRTGPKLLKAWRKRSKRSQEHIATELGVSQPALSEWEGGTRRPDFPVALELERMSDGALPIESWGYARSLIDTMRSVVERRDAATGTEG